MAILTDSPQLSSTAPTLSELLPKWTDRALFVGQTGSGKTTLAQVLLDLRPFVVVHDGKGRLDWKGYILVRKLREVIKLDPKRHPRIIYRPNEDESQSLPVQNAFFKWVYQRGNTTLYVDETYTLQIGGLWPMYHHACITRGRDGPAGPVEVWSGAQRPTWMPLAVLSEPEHYYSFLLRLEEDRNRMEGVSGIRAEMMDPKVLSKQEFWYVQTGEEPRGPYKLRLTEQRGR